MGSRALWAGPTLSIGSGVVLGIFQVQGWGMPDLLAVILVGGAILGICIAALALVVDLVPLLQQGRRRLEWRWPVRQRREPPPDPNQWLTDIARDDLENPVRHLLILDKYISNKDLSPTTRRPWIEFAVELYNGGVHTVIVGKARGTATYNSDPLADDIQGERGRSSKPRGHSHPYKLKQFVPPDVAASLYKELVAQKAIRSIGLNAVEIEVAAQIDGAPTVWLSLRNHDIYRERE